MELWAEETVWCCDIEGPVWILSTTVHHHPHSLHLYRPDSLNALSHKHLLNSWEQSPLLHNLCIQIFEFVFVCVSSWNADLMGNAENGVMAFSGSRGKWCYFVLSVWATKLLSPGRPSAHIAPLWRITVMWLQINMNCSSGVWMRGGVDVFVVIVDFVACPKPLRWRCECNMFRCICPLFSLVSPRKKIQVIQHISTKATWEHHSVCQGKSDKIKTERFLYVLHGTTELAEYIHSLALFDSKSSNRSMDCLLVGSELVQITFTPQRNSSRVPEHVLFCFLKWKYLPKWWVKLYFKSYWWRYPDPVLAHMSTLTHRI